MSNEIDIGQITEVLNYKADVDLTNTLINLSESSGAFYAKIGMPSANYVDLTAGDPGVNNTYEVLANGYISLEVRIAAVGNGIVLSCNGLVIRSNCSATNELCAGWLPVKAGDTLTYWYSTAATTNPVLRFRFIYAEGELV